MRIVIADDSETMRARAMRILRNAGHHVVGVGQSGPEAVALCARYRPDVAVLDITMPGGSGDDAARAILDAGSAAHVILASNQANDAILDPLKARGVVFCGKPYEAHSLLAKLIEVTREP